MTVARTEWTHVLRRLRARVAREGPEAVARAVPTARATLWRWLNGESRPSLAAFDAVRRLVCPDAIGGDLETALAERLGLPGAPRDEDELEVLMRERFAGGTA